MNKRNLPLYLSFQDLALMGLLYSYDDNLFYSQTDFIPPTRHNATSYQYQFPYEDPQTPFIKIALITSRAACSSPDSSSSSSSISWRSYVIQHNNAFSSKEAL